MTIRREEFNVPGYVTVITAMLAGVGALIVTYRWLKIPGDAFGEGLWSIGLWCLAAYSLLGALQQRPQLKLSPEGIELTTPLSTRRVAWGDLLAIELVRSRRRGFMGELGHELVLKNGRRIYLGPDLGGERDPIQALREAWKIAVPVPPDYIRIEPYDVRIED